MTHFNKIYNIITAPYSLNHTLQIFGQFYIQMDTFIAKLPVQKKHPYLLENIISQHLSKPLFSALLLRLKLGQICVTFFSHMSTK